MSSPGRTQIAVYAALGIVLALLAVKALGGAAGSAASAGEGDGGGVSIATAPSGAGGPQAAGGGLVVHVAGAVHKPGVYSLPAGSRVTDAVAKAGGAKPSADQDSINLAAMLADGQQVVVPAAAPSGTAAPAAADDATSDGPISLGSATEADLETIDGIGPVTAADIIEYRDSHGGVGSIDQLDEVPGIGPATIAALGERLQP